MRTHFNINENLLSKMHSITLPTCFVLDLGKGKSETSKYYIQQNISKKILLILNNISELNIFQDQIGKEKISIWHSKIGIPFNKTEFTTTFGITKQKFF